MSTYQWNNSTLEGTSYRNEGDIVHLSVQRSKPWLNSNVKFQCMTSKDYHYRYVECEFHFPNRELLLNRRSHYRLMPDKMKFYIDSDDDSCVLEISAQDVFCSYTIDITHTLTIEYIQYLMKSEVCFYSNDTGNCMVDPVVLVYALHLLLDVFKNEKLEKVSPLVT